MLNEHLTHILNKPVYKDVNCKENIRQPLINELHNVFWPLHQTIWIDGHQDYLNITSKMKELRSEYNHIIIAQTEEDTFYKYHIKALRTKISQDPYWSKKSFLLTNSPKDHAISRQHMLSVHKKGLLDLICYKPYDIQKVNTDAKYHTSFMYYYSRAPRHNVAEILLQNLSKCSVIKWQDLIYNNISAKINKGYVNDVPWIPFEEDYKIINPTAFIISLETLNNSAGVKLSRFAPTLSEKTFKAMHHCKPALIYGGSGTRQQLRSMGFDTWDWLIDWSFDDPKNRKHSLSLYLQELKRLMSLDITSINNLLKENKKSLIHNRRHVFRLINNYRDLA